MAMPQAKLQQIGEGAVERVERQDWLDPVADALQSGVAATFAAGGSVGRWIRDALHGTWLGHPLHPVLTDVPIGAWSVAAAVDLMNTSDTRRADRVAQTAITVGLAGAAGAAITGITDWHHTDGGARRVGLMHGLLNLSATGCYVASLVLRRRGARRAGRTAGALGFAISMGAAYLGGHLVYRKRIGVDHAPHPAWDDFVPLMRDFELADGTPRRFDVRGVAIVLVRRGNQVFALADRCAHLGGPLSEGSVEDCSIRCPWHGSRFALADGAALEGPATFAQPAFDVRVRDGQLEVRPRR